MASFNEASIFNAHFILKNDQHAQICKALTLLMPEMLVMPVMLKRSETIQLLLKIFYFVLMGV